MAVREVHNYSASFARNSVAMRNRQFLTDVTVICTTRSFCAHGHILCAGSPYFEEQISSMQEPIYGSELHLPTVSAETFETVLDFLYTGLIPPEVDNDAGKLTNMLRAAHTLRIRELYSFCVEHLHLMLSSRYFVDLWNLSVEFGETGRVRNLLEYVACNFSHASTCVDFFKLTHDQLDQLLQHPKIDRMDVDTIIKGILEWVKYDSNARREHLHELLSGFNVLQVSNEYIKVLLKSEPLVKDNTSVYDTFVAAASTRLLSERTTESTQVDPTTGPKLVCFGKRNNVSQVTVFDRQTCTWSTARPLPFLLSEGTAVAAYQSSLYFVGGGQDAANATDTIIQCSVLNWSVVQLLAMKKPIWKAGVGVLNDKMYVVGGMNRQNVVTNLVQSYDFNVGSCCYVAGTNMNYCLPIVVATLDHLFVVGSSFRTTVEKYDPLCGQWTVVCPMLLPGISPRATTCMQKLYVISDALEKKFRIFNPEENRWQEESYIGGPDDVLGMWSMCQVNSCLPFIFVRDGRKCLFSYSPDTKQWYALANPVNYPWTWWQTVLVV